MGILTMTLLVLFIVGFVHAKSDRYYEMIKDINDKKEYYTILGVERDADYSAIKRAVCFYGVMLLFPSNYLSTSWVSSSTIQTKIRIRKV
jgi:hypothetical protein